ncbi:MAG: uracil-DNA glycosylase family protein [Minisyncoccia bacterium]
MQVKKLHEKFNELHLKHGDKSLCSIYGAGCIEKPIAMFVFMNPTGKNVSSEKNWKGIRAPWLGTKNIWRLFYQLGIISEKFHEQILNLKPGEWSPDFALAVYKELVKKKIYVTNLAKCTQIDARPLKNFVFNDYLGLMLQEIEIIQPKNIITFGNQVSSILLQKQTSVSGYKGTKKEILKIGNKKIPTYPVYYPVGQGMRNMSLAAKRITAVIKS